MHSRLLLAFAALAAACSSVAADWKPAATPLMTKWGKQVTPDNAWQEYPRPQLVRKEWKNLNGLWGYAITAKGAPKPEKWDGQILVPFCAESALSGVGKHVTPEQNLWYRRTFEVPAGWKSNQRTLLNFEAVDWEAMVWVNGKELGTHRGMSDPFSFDITDALKDGANELVVRVWDPTDTGSQPRGKQVTNPHGIWYTPVTGIWQTVWMEPVPEESITGLRSETLLDDRVKVVIISPSVRGGKAEDRVRVFATRNGRPVAQGDALPNGEVSLPILNPEFWTPDTPNLYDLKLQIVRGDQVIDEVTSYFAMRKVSVGKDDKGILRLFLNNKPLFQVGPLDQGWWPDGLLTPPSDAAMKYDVEVLKKLGFNMLRKHIKVEPSRYYYHCDKLGMLVWQDMPSGMDQKTQFVRRGVKQDAIFTPEQDKQFRAELKAMIDHLRFFPCIYCWVPFNEGWGQHNTNEILKWVKEYDPTRLVNGPSGWEDRGYGDMKDMHLYPGPGMFPPMPDRVSVLGEFGGLGLPLEGHLWRDSKNWGYRTLRTTEELRLGYRQLMQRLHPLIGKGLAAAVYTQTTDVEIEVNGLMTYDREVVKFDPKETAAWHKALFGPVPEYREVVPTSEKRPQEWRYSFDKQPDGWEKPGFDDSKWKQGSGGFGTKGTPAAVIGTEWKTPEIWLRRTVEIKESPKGEVMLRVHCDEDGEVFINGVRAAGLPGYTTEYVEVPISAAVRKTLKPGANVIAVRARNAGGGQYIDVGLVEVVAGAK